MKTIPILLLVFICGCMSVPQTGIRFNPQTKALDIQSPKDVEIESATVVESNGFFSITVTGYKAKNNIEVIKAIAESNQKRLEDSAKVGGALLGTAIDLAK